eukprot:364575-Hanusia_phi.AAC.1
MANGQRVDVGRHQGWCRYASLRFAFGLRISRGRQVCSNSEGRRSMSSGKGDVLEGRSWGGCF